MVFALFQSNVIIDADARQMRDFFAPETGYTATSKAGYACIFRANKSATRLKVLAESRIRGHKHNLRAGA